MNLSNNEYLEFLSTMALQLNQDKSYLNNYFASNNGINYPFNVPEFNTFLYFDYNGMYSIFTKREYTKQEVLDFWKSEV